MPVVTQFGLSFAQDGPSIFSKPPYFGCIPATAEQREQMQPFDESKLPFVLGSYPDESPPITGYTSLFRTMMQFFTGACTSTTGTAATQDAFYRGDGRVVDLSWPDSYRNDVPNNPNLTIGSQVHSPLETARLYGICTNALMSEADTIKAGVSLQPSAAAQADGVKRKVRSWMSVPRDPDVIFPLLCQGIGVPYGYGNHAMYLKAYKVSANLTWSIDSMAWDTNGVRGIFISDFFAQTFDLCIVQAVDLTGGNYPADLSVQPFSTLFYGPVTQAITKTLLLLNRGGGAPKITVTTDDADFTVISGSGANVTSVQPVGIRWQSNVVGQKLANAIITPDAGPVLKASLIGFGTGVAPPPPPPPDPIAAALAYLQTARNLVGATVPDIPAALIAIDAARAALTGGVVINPPPPPPGGNWDVPPAASGMDAEGAVWNLGSPSPYGHRVMRNGVSTARDDKGEGNLIRYKNSGVYIQNSVGNWSVWTGSGWGGSAAP